MDSATLGRVNCLIVHSRSVRHITRWAETADVDSASTSRYGAGLSSVHERAVLAGHYNVRTKDIWSTVALHSPKPYHCSRRPTADAQPAKRALQIGLDRLTGQPELHGN